MNGNGPLLYDLDLEGRLLGMLMLLSETDAQAEAKRALGLVRPKDFFSTNTRLVYRAIAALDKRGRHFGLEAVHTLLEHRGKLNGTLSRFDLEQMQAEGSRAAPFKPEEEATLVRRLGEYREVLTAISEMRRFTEEQNDPPRLRAYVRQLLTALEQGALVESHQGHDLHDLLDLSFPPLVPVVQHLFYEGTSTLIVGGSKAGKSFLLLGVALAVASGDLALGTLETGHPRPVLYLNLDDGLRRIQSRAKDMLLSLRLAPRGMVRVEAQWPPLDRGGEGMLQHWCERHPTGLVVIDLLENIRPERAGSIYASDYHALRPLSDIAHSTGATLLIAHHTNKRGLSSSEEFDPIAAISGSMGVPGAVDGMLVFRPSKAYEDGARVNLIHRDAPRGEYELSRDEILNGWRFERESIQAQIKAKRSPQREKVLTTIQQAGRPLTPVQIAERLGWTPNAVRVLLFRMKNAADETERVVAYDDGTYQTPNEHARTGDPDAVTDSPNP